MCIKVHVQMCVRARGSQRAVTPYSLSTFFQRVFLTGLVLASWHSPISACLPLKRGDHKHASPTQLVLWWGGLFFNAVCGYQTKVLLLVRQALYGFSPLPSP